MDWQQTASIASATWFSIALLAGGLAGVQGRTKLGWFVGTLIFGPLALIFLVLSTTPRDRS